VLQASSGQPTTDYFVIVCVRRPVSFADLPAGDYLIGALTDIDLDELRRPSFLELVAGASLKVTIADGAKVSQALNIR
jgi:hypothetical protein